MTNLLTSIYHIALADFRERTRRYSFIVMLGLILFLGYLVNVEKFTMDLGEYRGVFNSAWIGATMAMVSTSMLALVGFYLVNNAVRRDIDTGVGQIIAATKVKNLTYLTGKFLSNFAVLSFMILVLAVCAVVMQYFKGSEYELKLWPLLSPFLFISIPAMAFAAAMATFFESIFFLRGALGNVLYYFVVMATVPIALETDIKYLDVLGMETMRPSMQEAQLAVYPDAKPGFSVGAKAYFVSTEYKLFKWEGVDWSLEHIKLRSIWLALAAFVVLLGSVFFDRFDSRRKQQSSVDSSGAVLSNSKVSLVRKSSEVHVLDRLQPASLQFSFLSVIISEFRVTLKRFPKIYYLVAISLFVATLFVPFKYVREIVMPVSWVWPLLLWSSLGTREKVFNTTQILFSSPSPVGRQLPAAWVVGFTVALTTASGVLFRAMLAGDMAYIGALLAGCLFVPGLALALGTISGSNKLFEVVYMMLWYVGPINHLPPIDFIGSTTESLAVNSPFILAGAGLVLAIVAFWSRSRQVRIG